MYFSSLILDMKITFANDVQISLFIYKVLFPKYLENILLTVHSVSLVLLITMIAISDIYLLRNEILTSCEILELENCKSFHRYYKLIKVKLRCIPCTVQVLMKRLSPSTMYTSLEMSFNIATCLK